MKTKKYFTMHQYIVQMSSFENINITNESRFYPIEILDLNLMKQTLPRDDKRQIAIFNIIGQKLSIYVQ